MINWGAIRAIYIHEMTRFFRTVWQSIASPEDRPTDDECPLRCREPFGSPHRRKSALRPYRRLLSGADEWIWCK